MTVSAAVVRCEKGNQTCKGSGGEKEGDKVRASKETACSQERCSLGELLATRVHTGEQALAGHQPHVARVIVMSFSAVSEGRK